MRVLTPIQKPKLRRLTYLVSKYAWVDLEDWGRACVVSEYTWFQSSYVVLWFRFNCVHVRFQFCTSQPALQYVFFSMFLTSHMINNHTKTNTNMTPPYHFPATAITVVFLSGYYSLKKTTASERSTDLEPKKRSSRRKRDDGRWERDYNGRSVSSVGVGGRRRQVENTDLNCL